MQGSGGRALQVRSPRGGSLGAGLALATLLATAAAAGATGPAGVLRAVDLKGLEARSAALLMSGQEAGDLEASFLALPLAATAEHRPVLLAADLVGASLLETAAGDELIVELYAYALGADGALAGSLSRAFRIDLGRWRETLAGGGVKFLGRLDLPAGELSLRLLVLHRASGRFALRSLSLEVPAPADPPAVPPVVADAPEPWLVVDGGAGTPLPPPFDDLAPLPATRLTVALGGSVTLEPVAAGGTPVARLLDLEGRPLAELFPAVAGERLALPIAGQPPGSYQLELSPDGAPGRALRLPLELVTERPPGAVAWFQQPVRTEPADEVRTGAAVATGREEPGQVALAAYRRSFAVWRQGGLEEAAAELRRFETGSPEAATLADGERSAGEQLAAGDLESLVPLMCLHEHLFRDYHARGSYLLATHSRRLADHYARLYAARGRRPEAGRTAALVLVSLAGMRQESGTRLAALATFEAALELDAQQPEALLGLAALHESLGAYQTTVELLRRLERSAGLSPAARIRLAINLGRVGSTRQALALLAELAGQPPEWISLLAYQEQARLLDRDRKTEAALAVTETALVRHPGEQMLILQRAALLDRLGRPLDSRRLLAALDGGVGDRGDSARLRYSALPSREIAAARTRLAAAAADRLAGLADGGAEDPARGAS